MSQVNSWPSTHGSLLARVKDPTDEAAWRTFVDTYLPPVYNYCRRSGLQDADAQNVAQNVFLQLMRTVPEFQYDPGRGRFRHWLGLMAHREMLQYLKRLRRAGQGQGDGGGDAIASREPSETDGAWIDAVQAHLYETAIDRIRADFNDETWRAFELVWTDGHTPQEVAELFQRSTQWVYQAKYKVLQRLKAEIRYLAGDLPGWE